MKLFTLAAAGLTLLTGLAPVAIATPAAAQHRTVVRERTVVRHDDRGYHHRRVHTRRVCQREWRHGHRERVCRTVRSYR
ncbi:hypothetical protein SAMN05192583_0205 [Sphingomonas gellani]|uniref:Uncharacterized protein n=1 Tax=Sphingomonas gellani TaxID=1166340 RepID=A0A1H7YEG3_9SPHN|nr:hypothetical protein [Sphingomonas gellani]SEM43698.1 hypothetical protein SAMN05192583_0205 [Sphingomonas gellani]